MGSVLAVGVGLQEIGDWARRPAIISAVPTSTRSENEPNLTNSACNFDFHSPLSLHNTIYHHTTSLPSTYTPIHPSNSDPATTAAASIVVCISSLRQPSGGNGLQSQLSQLARREKADRPIEPA